MSTAHNLLCHSREGGNPELFRVGWMPACAGMTRGSSVLKDGPDGTTWEVKR